MDLTKRIWTKRASHKPYLNTGWKFMPTTLLLAPSDFQTFRHPWDRAQCGGLTAFQKNGQAGANTVASSRSSINLRFFLDPHPLANLVQLYFSTFTIGVFDLELCSSRGLGVFFFFLIGTFSFSNSFLFLELSLIFCP